MNSDDWWKMISTVGFPIVVASYLLIRVEKVLGDVRDGIRELILIHRPKPPTEGG